MTTKPEGHGFGLHASACTAAEMDGSLSVRSKGVGCGAVFTLIVPLRRNGLDMTAEQEPREAA